MPCAWTFVKNMACKWTYFSSKLSVDPSYLACLCNVGCLHVGSCVADVAKYCGTWQLSALVCKLAQAHTNICTQLRSLRCCWCGQVYNLSLGPELTLKCSLCCGRECSHWVQAWCSQNDSGWHQTITWISAATSRPGPTKCWALNFAWMFAPWDLLTWRTLHKGSLRHRVGAFTSLCCRTSLSPHKQARKRLHAIWLWHIVWSWDTLYPVSVPSNPVDCWPSVNPHKRAVKQLPLVYCTVKNTIQKFMHLWFTS